MRRVSEDFLLKNWKLVVFWNVLNFYAFSYQAFNFPALLSASFTCEGPSSHEEKEKSIFLSQLKPPLVSEEALTDSFQSLPLPSTSSSTSGVHEDDESPSEKLIGGGFCPEIFGNFTNLGEGSQMPQSSVISQNNGDVSTIIAKSKVKPPVPLWRC